MRCANNCKEPAAWLLQYTKRGSGSWACEACAIKALLLDDVVCSDGDGEQYVLEGGELRVAL